MANVWNLLNFIGFGFGTGLGISFGAITALSLVKLNLKATTRIKNINE